MRSETRAAARPPLRVVHVADGCGPEAANGVGRAVYYLARAQQALGHDVTVVSERARHVDALMPHSPAPLEVARHRLATSMRVVSPALVREIVALRPDIVHMHSVHLPEHILLARRLRAADIRYCVTVHGGLSRPAQRRSRLKKRTLWWIGERAYFGGAHFVHALTRQEAEDIRTFGVRGRIVVAPNGIAPSSVPRPRNANALFELAPELARHRVFLFMGRVALAQKGLDLLVQGLSRANLPEVRLVVLGPDWRNGRWQLEREARRLAIGSQVRFVESQAPQRCADFVAGADVFVHTSRWEGVSLAVLEAAAWAKPCLLTDAADPGGTIGRGGGAVVVGANPDGIAEGLRTFARLDRCQLVAMGTRARSAVMTQFAWDRTAGTLLEAYGCKATCG